MVISDKNILPLVENSDREQQRPLKGSANWVVQWMPCLTLSSFPCQYPLVLCSLTPCRQPCLLRLNVFIFSKQILYHCSMVMMYLVAETFSSTWLWSLHWCLMGSGIQLATYSYTQCNLVRKLHLLGWKWKSHSSSFWWSACKVMVFWGCDKTIKDHVVSKEVQLGESSHCQVVDAEQEVDRPKHWSLAHASMNGNTFSLTWHCPQLPASSWSRS